MTALACATTTDSSTCPSPRIAGHSRWNVGTLTFPAALMTLLMVAANAWGQAEADIPKKTALGQFVTVTSPVDDHVFAKISNVAIKLQSQSVQEGRPAYLVLQVEAGTSQFHHVQGLAKFLTSAQIKNVTTVAWVPQTVTGQTCWWRSPAVRL